MVEGTQVSHLSTPGEVLQKALAMVPHQAVDTIAEFCSCDVGGSGRGGFLATHAQVLRQLIKNATEWILPVSGAPRIDQMGA